MKAYQRLAQLLSQTGKMGNLATCEQIASRLAQIQHIRAICEDDVQRFKPYKHLHEKVATPSR